jgi:Xaa-Pro aminopeptidase
VSPAIDFDRLARERFARTLEAMEGERIDLLLLARAGNAQYVSGARRVQVAGSGGGVPSVIVSRGSAAPLVYTTDLDGIPAWMAGSGRPMWWSPANLVDDIRTLAAPLSPSLRVAYDVLSVAFLNLLENALPGAEWKDAEELLARLRAVKSADEIVLGERALRTAEDSLDRVSRALQPGMSGRELAGIQMQSPIEAGASFLAEEPVATREGDEILLRVALIRDGVQGESTRICRVGDERMLSEPVRALATGAPDLVELARGRRAKVDDAIERNGLDALVLLKSANVRYATGASARLKESSREALAPLAAILAARRTPLVLAPDGSEAASEPAAERELASFFLDDEIGAERFADLLKDAVPEARRLAIDRCSVPLRTALQRVFPNAEWLDAESILAPVRMVKLPAEIQLLRRAQELNEEAIGAVLRVLRPGAREIDLTAVFHGRLGELGVTTVVVESVWCALPKTRREAPWSPPESFPYRELTSERVLADGDLVVMDTGIAHQGYLSDFGRTWRCGGPATDGERRLFEEWVRVRDRLFAACRPGKTALDLRHAALAGWRRREPPWPLPLYVAHSIGLGGVEPPFVGTDLGEAIEERWTLEPGMVIVFEPYVWEEGVGGYRAEETVVVTEQGCEPFTHFGYGAFASIAS